MKPDWSTAPKWANYLAMDKTAEWWWYEEKPRLEFGRWISSSRYSRAGFIYWRDTLEERPVHIGEKE
jgi:hypothetical protein